VLSRGFASTALFASAALLAGVFASVTGARDAAPAPPILFAADHRPALDGEIYRLDLNGRRLDLSRSPFEDTQLQVAPNGRHVAFVSDRGHGTRVYVVGIDGRGLRTVSSALPAVGEPELDGWSPDGTRLAASSGTVRQTSLYVLQAGRPQRVVARVPSARASIGTASWSADGRAVAFPIFFSGPPNPIPRVRVVDEHGETRATFRAGPFAWSPEGERIASVEKHQLTVRDGAGQGPVVLRVSSIAATGIFWVDANHLVLFKTDPLGGPPTRVGIEVPSGRAWKPAARLVSAQICGCASPDGSRIAETAKVAGGFAVRVARAEGSGARTVLNVPGCMDDGVSVAAVTSLQFAAAGRLVYQSSCPEPQLDLYAVDANGSGLHALTRTSAEETDPALSPDGTRIAYVRADARGFSCKGCPSTIWEMNADGTDQHALTQPTDEQWDSQPSWSPDGTQLVFSRSFIDSGPRLFVVPAAGGAVRDLNVSGSAPAWGPAYIAYAAKGGIARVGPDGIGAHLVAGAVNPLAAWSQTGTLAYVDQRQGHDAVLVVGGRRAKLTFPSVDSLSWTADGKRVVLFAADRRTGSLSNVPFDVYSVRPDGSGVRRLTTNVSGWPD
jgi:Tol biopolymer transport system component